MSTKKAGNCKCGNNCKCSPICLCEKKENKKNTKYNCSTEYDFCGKNVCQVALPTNPCVLSFPPKSYQQWKTYCDYRLTHPCTGPCAPINFLYDFRLAWNPDDFDFIFGLDGVATADATGLTVNSRVYTSTIPVGNEHVKWLRFHKNVFPLCDTHEVVFEADMAVQQFIPAEIPEEFIPRIRNVNDDIRLASAAMNVIDPNTWMVFDFFMSNTAIYAFYERLPFGKPDYNGGNLTPLGDYAAFSNAIWVGRRSGVNPLNDFSRLAIGIHKGKGIVTWYLDGTPVFSINTIGYRAHDEYRLLDHGGVETKVDVESVRFGFGTFSLLDMAMPNNYDRFRVINIAEDDPALREIAATALVQIDFTQNYRELYPNPITGQERMLVNPDITFAYTLNETPDNNRDVKLFGQGSILKVRSIRAFSRPDNAPLEVAKVNN
ncbi:putative fibril associated protein [Tupanvirus deep ocean]|uniref:Fibril associated protein n=2 Tax=Tupanvirus TaxID=2094720 RepID=A0AC62A961_9VIRU|nr:putative fibril associated protein [Tupanvirus deep ocean]QKU34326.1 putative fibril associated protein [Tupanvirus deep ocean]